MPQAAASPEQNPQPQEQQQPVDPRKKHKRLFRRSRFGWRKNKERGLGPNDASEDKRINGLEFDFGTSGFEDLKPEDLEMQQHRFVQESPDGKGHYVSETATEWHQRLKDLLYNVQVERALNHGNIQSALRHNNPLQIDEMGVSQTFGSVEQPGKMKRLLNKLADTSGRVLPMGIQGALGGLNPSEHSAIKGLIDRTFSNEYITDPNQLALSDTGEEIPALIKIAEEVIKNGKKMGQDTKVDSPLAEDKEVLKGLKALQMEISDPEMTPEAISRAIAKAKRGVGIVQETLDAAIYNKEMQNIGDRTSPKGVLAQAMELYGSAILEQMYEEQTPKITQESFLAETNLAELEVQIKAKLKEAGKAARKETRDWMKDGAHKQYGEKRAQKYWKNEVARLTQEALEERNMHMDHVNQLIEKLSFFKKTLGEHPDFSENSALLKSIADAEKTIASIEADRSDNYEIMSRTLESEKMKLVHEMNLIGDINPETFDGLVETYFEENRGKIISAEINIGGEMQVMEVTLLAHDPETNLFTVSLEDDEDPIEIDAYNIPELKKAVFSKYEEIRLERIRQIEAENALPQIEHPNELLGKQCTLPDPNGGDFEIQTIIKSYSEKRDTFTLRKVNERGETGESILYPANKIYEAMDVELKQPEPINEMRPEKIKLGSGIEVPYNNENFRLTDDGVLTGPEDNHIYHGEWKDGNFEGNGKLESTQPGFASEYDVRVQNYEGQFQGGQKHGTGQDNYEDGMMYVGNFEHGKREGDGRLVNNEGDDLRGETWKNGELYEIEAQQHPDALKHLSPIISVDLLERRLLYLDAENPEDQQKQIMDQMRALAEGGLSSLQDVHRKLNQFSQAEGPLADLAKSLQISFDQAEKASKTQFEQTWLQLSKRLDLKDPLSEFNIEEIDATADDQEAFRLAAIALRGKIFTPFLRLANQGELFAQTGNVNNSEFMQKVAQAGQEATQRANQATEELTRLFNSLYEARQQPPAVLFNEEEIRNRTPEQQKALRKEAFARYIKDKILPPYFDPESDLDLVAEIATQDMNAQEQTHFNEFLFTLGLNVGFDIFDERHPELRNNVKEHMKAQFKTALEAGENIDIDNSSLAQESLMQSLESMQDYADETEKDSPQGKRLTHALSSLKKSNQDLFYRASNKFDFIGKFTFSTPTPKDTLTTYTEAVQERAHGEQPQEVKDLYPVLKKRFWEAFLSLDTKTISEGQEFSFDLPKTQGQREAFAQLYLDNIANKQEHTDKLKAMIQNQYRKNEDSIKEWMKIGAEVQKQTRNGLEEDNSFINIINEAIM